MKNYSRFFIGLCLLFAGIGFSTQSFAFSEDDLEKFKTLRECEKCDLSGAEITGLSATQAKLAGANLSGAKITNCRFMQADLSNVNLTNAVLINTTLMHANLTGANLTNATLTKVEVRSTNFKDAILSGLKMDDKTKSTFKSAKNVPAGTPGSKKASAQLCTSELSVCKGSLEDALKKKELFSDRWRAIVKKESEYKQTISKLKSEVSKNAQFKQLYNDAMAQNKVLQDQEKARKREDEQRGVTNTYLAGRLDSIARAIRAIRWDDLPTVGVGSSKEHGVLTYASSPYWVVVTACLRDVVDRLELHSGWLNGLERRHKEGNEKIVGCQGF